VSGDGGYRYRWVEVDIEPNERVATLTVTGPPRDEVPGDLEQIVEAAASWWPLAMARELDDALLMLRANHREIGTLVLKTRGAIDATLAVDRTMIANQGHWFVRETIGFLRTWSPNIGDENRSRNTGCVVISRVAK